MTSTGYLSKGFMRIAPFCLAISFADASWSATIPIFPGYAESLGASLITIGFLGSVMSISTLLTSIPLGSISDRTGRKSIMLVGMACFIVTPLLYTLSSSPVHLLLARVLLGVAVGSTFSIGFVYITELAGSNVKSLAQGLYMTSMGIGFTVGPLLGGLVAKIWGYTISFYLSSLLGASATLLTVLSPKTDVGSEKSIQVMKKEGVIDSFKKVTTNPRILAAGLANFFNSMLFNAIITFFPLYCSLIGFDESQVGTSLAVRGLSSTASRFPAGTSSSRFGAFRLVLFGLVVSAIILVALPLFSDYLIIVILMGIQGLAYGIYLTSGNVYIIMEAPIHQRGTAIGVYMTFSNVSGIVSPILLGALAEAWGFSCAFQVSGILALMGTVLTILTARSKKMSYY